MSENQEGFISAPATEPFQFDTNNDTLLGGTGNDLLTEAEVIADDPPVVEKTMGVVPEALKSASEKVSKNIQSGGKRPALFEEELTDKDRKYYDARMKQAGEGIAGGSEIGSTRSELRLLTPFPDTPQLPDISAPPLEEKELSLEEKARRITEGEGEISKSFLEEAVDTVIATPLAFLGGITPEADPFKEKDKSLNVETGLIGGTEELVKLIVASKSFVSEVEGGLEKVLSNPSAIVSDLEQMFSTKVKDRSEEDFLFPILYSKGTEEAKQTSAAIAKMSKSMFKEMVGLDQEASAERFYDSVRSSFSTEIDNPVTQTASIAGLLASTWGNVLGAPRLSMQVLRNAERGLAASYFAKKIGAKKAFDEVAFRQVFNFDPAKTPLPTPFYRAYDKNQDSPFMQHLVKKYENRGVPRDVAIKRAETARRDIVAAGVGAGFYTLGENAFESEEASMMMALTGSLMGNYLTKNVRMQGSNAFFKLSSLFAMQGGNRQKSIKAFRDSDFKGMSKYRRTFLRMNGITGIEMRNAQRMSFAKGEEALRDILETEKQKGSSQALKLKQKYINDNTLDEKGRAHGWYHLGILLDSKLNKETIRFGSTLYKSMMEEGGEQTEIFMNNSIALQNVLDGLSAKSPKAMEKFPIVFENMVPFLALRQMRNELMNSVQFNSFSGKAISGDLLTQIEKHHNTLGAQTQKLQEALKEFSKQTDIENSDVLKSLLKDMNEMVSLKDFGFSLQQIGKLRQYASTPQNLEKLALEQSKQKLKILSGIDDINNPVVSNEHGDTMIRLIGTSFDNTKKQAERPFESLKEEFGNIQVDITDFLKNIPSELEVVDKNLRGLIKGLGKFDSITTERLHQKISTDFFKKQMGLSGKDALDTPEKYASFKESLRDFVNNQHSGSAEEKSRTLNALLANANTQEASLIQAGRSVDYSKLADLAVSGVIREFPIPSAINIESLMAIRSEMSSEARRFYKSRDFDRYRQINLRIQQFDDTMAATPEFGADLMAKYRDARNSYSKIFGPYLDEGGPFAFIANKNPDKERQPLSKHKIFQVFFTKGNDMGLNAKQFEQVFSDANGNINPEAVDELIYSMTHYMTDSFNNVSMSNLDTLLSDMLIHFGDIIRRSDTPTKKRSEFLDTLESMRNLYSKPSSEFQEARQATSKVIQDTLASTYKAKIEAFENSAIVIVGGPRSDALGVQLKPVFTEMTKIQENLLSRVVGDARIGYDTHANFMVDLYNTQAYKNLASKYPEMLDEIDRVVESSEFRTALKSISDSEAGASGKTVVETIMSDLNKKLQGGKLTQAEFDGIQKNLGVLVEEDLYTHMFPYVNRAQVSATNINTERTASLRVVLKRIAEERGIPASQVRYQFEMKNPDILQELRNKGVTQGSLSNMVGSDLKKYKFNLEHEYDPIAAQTWWDKHGETFALVKGQEHADFIKLIMQAGVATTKRADPALNIKDVPREQGINQVVGRFYNTFAKRVVSPAYIGMERIIVDYRVMQANIVKDLISNKNSAKVIKDIYVQGLFKPKEVRTYLKDLLLKMAADGYKLTDPLGLDGMMRDLEKTALDVSREK